LKKINSKHKGRRGEQYFVHLLKGIYPDIHRNWKSQTFGKHNGSDLEAINCLFNFESKIGKLPLANEKFLAQVKAEGDDKRLDVVLCKRDRYSPYVLIPFDDFLQILGIMKAENIL